jgi:hypothetical protein
MLTRDALWLVEEPVLDEPADLMTIQALKHHLAREPYDDELGLKSLFETPDALPSPGWCEEPSRPRRSSGKTRKRRGATAA